jgi:hypothetical protein
VCVRESVYVCVEAHSVSEVEIDECMNVSVNYHFEIT